MKRAEWGQWTFHTQRVKGYWGAKPVYSLHQWVYRTCTFHLSFFLRSFGFYKHQHCYENSQTKGQCSKLVQNKNRLLERYQEGQLFKIITTHNQSCLLITNFFKVVFDIMLMILQQSKRLRKPCVRQIWQINVILLLVTNNSSTLKYLIKIKGIKYGYLKFQLQS